MLFTGGCTPRIIGSAPLKIRAKPPHESLHHSDGSLQSKHCHCRAALNLAWGPEVNKDTFEASAVLGENEINLFPQLWACAGPCLWYTDSHGEGSSTGNYFCPLPFVNSMRNMSKRLRRFSLEIQQKIKFLGFFPPLSRRKPIYYLEGNNLSLRFNYFLRGTITLTWSLFRG